MKASVTFKGGRELERLLAELPPAVARKVATKALRAGAKPLLAAEREKVPVATGELKKALKVRVTRTAETNRREVGVGVRGKESRLAHLVEFGTAPHPIEAQPGKKLAFTAKSGKRVVVTKVDHPGAKAQPFLRPAADTRHQEAISEIGRVAGVEVVAEAKKLGQR
jgi:HK97 gp10 family phage protein